MAEEPSPDGIKLPYHKPVMLKECIRELELKADGTYVDVTFGGGGHSEIMVQMVGKGRLIAFDQDPDAWKNASAWQNENFQFVKANFRFSGALPRKPGRHPRRRYPGRSGYQFLADRRTQQRLFDSLRRAAGYADEQLHRHVGRRAGERVPAQRSWSASSVPMARCPTPAAWPSILVAERSRQAYHHYLSTKRRLLGPGSAQERVQVSGPGVPGYPNRGQRRAGSFEGNAGTVCQCPQAWRPPGRYDLSQPGRPSGKELPHYGQLRGQGRDRYLRQPAQRSRSSLSGRKPSYLQKTSWPKIAAPAPPSSAWPRRSR